MSNDQEYPHQELIQNIAWMSAGKLTTEQLRVAVTTQNRPDPLELLHIDIPQNVLDTDMVMQMAEKAGMDLKEVKKEIHKAMDDSIFSIAF